MGESAYDSVAESCPGTTPAQSARSQCVRSSPQDDFVAVLEERARLAGRQLNRLGAAPGELEQAAASSFSGPEMVPLASRSPGTRLQPLEVWCATSWATVQYMSRKLPRLRRMGSVIVRGAQPDFDV